MLDALDILQSSPDETDPAAQAIRRAEHRLRVLQELTEIGMDLVRGVHRRAMAEAEAPAADPSDSPPPADTPTLDPADAYARLSRAVRLSIALEARADATLGALIAGLPQAQEKLRLQAERLDAARTARRNARCESRVRDLVGEVIGAEAPDRETHDALLAALEERLDEDEAYVDFEDRPLRETVERLCHDLCLQPDWSRWAGEGWRRAGPPARPMFSAFHRPGREPVRRRGLE